MGQLLPKSALATANMLEDDGVFGPQYGHEFDFTMVFSNAILTIGPAALMIAACPIYVLAYFGKLPVAVTSRLLLLKLVRA